MSQCASEVTGTARRTDVDGLEVDHGAVGLIHDAVDLLQGVRVREDLVAGDEVLLLIAGSVLVLCRNHDGGAGDEGVVCSRFCCRGDTVVAHTL